MKSFFIKIGVFINAFGSVATLLASDPKPFDDKDPTATSFLQAQAAAAPTIEPTEEAADGEATEPTSDPDTDSEGDTPAPMDTASFDSTVPTEPDDSDSSSDGSPEPMEVATTAAAAAQPLAPQGQPTTHAQAVQRLMTQQGQTDNFLPRPLGRMRQQPHNRSDSMVTQPDFSSRTAEKPDSDLRHRTPPPTIHPPEGYRAPRHTFIWAPPGTPAPDSSDDEDYDSGDDDGDPEDPNLDDETAYYGN